MLLAEFSFIVLSKNGQKQTETQPAMPLKGTVPPKKTDLTEEKDATQQSCTILYTSAKRKTARWGGAEDPLSAQGGYISFPYPSH